MIIVAGFNSWPCISLADRVVKKKSSCNLNMYNSCVILDNLTQQKIAMPCHATISPHSQFGGGGGGDISNRLNGFYY